MAQDIVPMKPEKAQCPCCGTPLLVEWNLAVYGDGGDSYQFSGLALDTDAMAESLRAKTYTLKKPKLVQLQNPITRHWVVVDKTHGRIVKHSRTTKPYKHIRIVRSANPATKQLMWGLVPTAKKEERESESKLRKGAIITLGA